MKMRDFVMMIASLIMLAGCAQATGLTTTSDDAAAEQPPAAQEATATELPAEESAPEPAAASVAEESAGAPTVDEVAAPSAPATQDVELVIAPIEVTYFTPSQAEGPYYTVDKPADRDNDLVEFAGATATPVGEIIEFTGSLYDAAGMPVAGAVVEIWQTDSKGVYLHSGDPQTAQRDMNFQFYGESSTALDGSYNFRTILPGQYEPRPRHIHVKVKLDGQELLTTQFYFASDDSRLADSLFAGAGSEAEAMVMAVTAGVDAAGNSVLIGQRDIILSITLSNE